MSSESKEAIERKEMAAIFGTLLEWLLEQTGGPNPVLDTADSHLAQSRVNAKALRDRLLDMAEQYPFDWSETKLSRSQLKDLGINVQSKEEVAEMRRRAAAETTALLRRSK